MPNIVKITATVSLALILMIGSAGSPSSPASYQADMVNDVVTIITNPTSGLPPCC